MGGAVYLALVLAAMLVPGLVHAQSGHFVIPSQRGSVGEFAYWDLFQASGGGNYNYDNPPALLPNAFGADFDGNLTNLFAPRVSLVQNGTPSAFVTSSNAIYSFSAATAFEVRYMASTANQNPVNNVIFQTQTGGSRLDIASVRLIYTTGVVSHTVLPLYFALDDPGSGQFSERLVCGFQWDLTGLGVRDFKIVFASPEASMPLWEAQLDVVAGMPFTQQLGYLLTTHVRPVTRFDVAGSVEKNLTSGQDGRYFHAGDQLHLTGDAADNWEPVGWVYEGQVSTTASLDLTFPAQDIDVTGLFSPLTYAGWRRLMFNHLNSLTGTANDHTNNAISGPAVDHDGDTISNLAEYAFGGDPYTSDPQRTQPQSLLVQISGEDYPAIRYRTNGAKLNHGDVAFSVQLSTDLTAWVDNSTTPTTVTVNREQQSDGTLLVTERALQPKSSFTTVAMRIGWKVSGAAQLPMLVPPPSISSTTLVGGLVNTGYSAQLIGCGGAVPYTWSVSNGTLHAGLTLGATGLLSGTPSEAGTSTFTVQILDGAGITASKTLSLTVAPYTITTASLLATVLTGSSYNFPFTVSGGTAPFLWTIADGVLPPGVSLTTEGALNGIPTTAGTYHFTVQIKDANGFITTKAMQLTVVNFTITNASPLVAAVKGGAYTQTFSATGGTVPYIWSFAAGSTLPAGLTLNQTTGVVTGKPSVFGDFSFTLKVTDASTFSATKAFTLTVTATYLKPVLTQPVLGTTTVGMPFSFTPVATNYPSSFTVTGLPAGIKYVPATKTITGRATVSGVFNVRITAVNSAGASTALVSQLTVKALPNTLMGSFT
ncbi:MAG: putative Ig protein, partial [Verrucomicrobiaceae bacterium]|nr:putative Ig protein [Verrucomicrobiaceae bacterium]